MFKLKKSQKIALFIILGIIIAFLLEKVVFSVIRTKIKDLNKKIKLQELALREGLSVQKNKDKIIQDYKNYSQYLLTETQDRDITAKFLKEVEKITRDAGLSVVSLVPEDKFEQKPNYKEYRVNQRLEGRMGQLLNLFDKIQNSPLLIKLNELTITSKDEETGTLSIEAIIGLAVP